jgi:sugar phosphate isomerase/epimerase
MWAAAEAPALTIQGHRHDHDPVFPEADMKNEFSLVYLTTPGCSPPEMIHMAARAGFDYVSLRIIPMGLATEPRLALASDKDLLAQTRRALNDTGVRLHDVENARILDGVRIADYEPSLELAAELGARHVLTNVWTSDRVLATEALAELGERADRFGLGVIVEFVTWASVATLQEAAELVHAAGSPNAGVIVDCLHFNRSQCSLDDLERHRDLLRFVHLCDAPAEIPATKEALLHAGRAERLYPGDGGIDLAAIVRRLPPMVYGIEAPNLALAAEIGNAEHVFRCLEKTRTYFERHAL